MKTEKIVDGIRYTLSNEDLKEGDKVYPIARGRVLDNDEFILHNFDFRDFMSGFPDEPHTILNLKHSDYKPYQIRTDCGYGPIEMYYKIIKKEHQVKVSESMFGGSYEWQIITE